MTFEKSRCIWGQGSKCLYVAIVTGCLASDALSQEPGDRIAKSAHVKGVNILSVSFPFSLRMDEIKGFTLQTTFDGEAYIDLGVGHPRPERLFNSIRPSNGEVEILVVVVGSLQYSDGAFFPEVSGNYSFRWKLWAKGGSQEGEEVSQTVGFEPATGPDLVFLSRLGDLRLFHLLYGESEDNPERLLGPRSSDIRALKTVFKLLEATRFLVPDDVFGPGKRSQEDAPHWAETLWALVEETPDSSYAPYAAFYSGLCDAGLALGQAVDGVRAARVPGERKDKFAEYRRRVELLQQDERFGKALRALKFATERSDDYLRPIALSQLGFLTVCGGNVDEGKKLLQESVEILGVGGSRVEHIQKQLLEIEEIQKGIGGQSAQEPNK